MIALTRGCNKYVLVKYPVSSTEFSIFLIVVPSAQQNQSRAKRRRNSARKTRRVWARTDRRPPPKTELLMYIALYQPLGQDNEEKISLVCEALDISPRRVDRFHPSSNAIGALPDQKGCYSWCKPLPEGFYDAIVFLPGCKLYPNSWSSALLIHCFNALRSPKGKLVTSFAKSRAEVDSGLVQLSQLSEILGPPERVIGELAVFGAVAYRQQPPSSTLSWFLSNWGRAYFYFSEFQALENREPNSIRLFFAENPALRTNVAPCTNKDLAADFLSQEQESLVRFLVFSVYGVNAKSHVLAKILRDTARRSNLSWADIGGGSGLLGLQLLLDTPSIASVINFEKSPAQAMIGADASTYFPREVSNRYLTWVCRVDDPEFDFQSSFDVVTMLTTLCYIPRHSHRTLLEKAWSALNPGGTLIILENIRSSTYSRDHYLMFTDDELDELLLEFNSRIEYYSAITGVKVDGRTMRGKTCYRVLRKD